MLTSHVLCEMSDMISEEHTLKAPAPTNKHRQTHPSCGTSRARSCRAVRCETQSLHLLERLVGRAHKQVTFIFVIAINSQSSLDEVVINETTIAALTFGVRQHVITNNQCTDVHTHRHTAILLVHVCTDICTQTHAQTEGKRHKLTDTKTGRHSKAQTDRQTGRQS